MSEFLPQQQSKSRNLRHNQYLEIKFTVQNPGRISVLAFADWWREWDPESRAYLTNPTKRKVELFKPGANVPIITRTDEGRGQTTRISYEVPAREAGADKEWTARVTNLEGWTELFLLRVVYPGTIPIETFTVPSSLVEAFVDATIGQTKIRVTRGENASYVDFPEDLDIEDRYFTIEDFVWEIPGPFPAIREYPNDINSSDIAFSLENAAPGYSNGFMRLAVEFEEEGKEILGTWHGHLSNMKLLIELGLGVQDSKITYHNVDVSFLFDIDMLGVPDWIADALFGYKKKIQRTVQNTVRQIFQNEQTRRNLSNALMQEITPALGSNAKIVSVKIQNNMLKVRYYKA